MLLRIHLFRTNASEALNSSEPSLLPICTSVFVFTPWLFFAPCHFLSMDQGVPTSNPSLSLELAEVNACDIALSYHTGLIYQFGAAILHPGLEYGNADANAIIAPGRGIRTTYLNTSSGSYSVTPTNLNDSATSAAHDAMLETRGIALQMRDGDIDIVEEMDSALVDTAQSPPSHVMPIKPREPMFDDRLDLVSFVYTSFPAIPITLFLITRSILIQMPVLSLPLLPL
ncbi:hypothetical protein BJ912DRAFT_1059360 [Pholiota molesta]|nr:hypothetical protein BJ912DRAFT_1059360 [Pholiota molesta]